MREKEMAEDVREISILTLILQMQGGGAEKPIYIFHDITYNIKQLSMQFI